MWCQKSSSKVAWVFRGIHTTSDYPFWPFLRTWGHVEDEWDSAAEGDHDDAEGDEEEEDVLQHAAYRQDDGAEVLCRDANLEMEN